MLIIEIKFNVQKRITEHSGTTKVIRFVFENRHKELKVNN
jgi:hypothetical protein